MDIETLVTQEHLHMQKLEQLVQEAVKEEQLLSSRLLELERDSDLTVVKIHERENAAQS